MKKLTILSVLVISIGTLYLTGCNDDEEMTPSSPYINASDWVSNADWDARTTIVVDMVEESATHYHFNPEDITLEAGKPYVLKFTNSANNAEKHYFATPDGEPDFFKSIATRKVQTPDAEYKAPYFTAVELLKGGELEIYFIPVLSGIYNFLCTIPGHAEKGMIGTITVTGGEGYQLDLEVATDFNSSLMSDPRTSGSNDVWTNANEVDVNMIENLELLSFSPEDLNLTKDSGYKIKLINKSINKSKHYYTAEKFFKTVVTRKAEDSYAEIKVPYFKAVELLIGGSTTLFMVPTIIGEYEVICTIEGHQASGMHGHINVGTIPASPHVNSSDWVSNADWDARTIITVDMVEESATHYHFNPENITLEAGKPYVLKFTNSANNAEKHYFATPDGEPDFFKSIATRKVQTPDAEYKAPYFTAVELLKGGELEIYFVPVLSGTYNFLCTIPGHAELGMVGTITVTGGAGYELDLEVAADFNTSLMSDPRTSGSHDVWSNATDVEVQMTENADGSLAFTPEDLNLTNDSGYKIKLVNQSTNISKHYYTAGAFYKTTVTRKAEDSNAEIKAPYFKAVELLIGGSTTLFMVPTVIGQYEVICTIEGHQASGMHGHINVN